MIVVGDADPIGWSTPSSCCGCWGRGTGDLAEVGRAGVAILPGTTHYTPVGSGILNCSDWLLPVIADSLHGATDVPSGT